MGRQSQKLIMEVDTCWNSIYLMLKRLFKLATLKTDVSPLTSHEYGTIKESLPVLAPFHQATVESSEERQVSVSKVIPLMKILHHAVLAKSEQLTSNVAKQLSDNLIR